MKRIRLPFILCLMLFISTGCLKDTADPSEHSYDTTKKMVIDIIQTDEGKKALMDVLSDDEMESVLILDNDVVKDTIADVLNSEDGVDTWTNYFSDPMFAQEFASSMEENHKGLLNNLMTDADFQKYFLDVLKNTEVSEQMIGALKSQPFREYLEETIEDALNSPSFQSKMTDTLLKAAEKQKEKEDSNEDNKTEEENEE